MNVIVRQHWGSKKIYRERLMDGCGQYWKGGAK